MRNHLSPLKSQVLTEKVAKNIVDNCYVFDIDKKLVRFKNL